ncbi:unnamed protein product, partial [Amoebophrya sp. A120]
VPFQQPSQKVSVPSTLANQISSEMTATNPMGRAPSVLLQTAVIHLLTFISLPTPFFQTVSASEPAGARNSTSLPQLRFLGHGGDRTATAADRQAFEQTAQNSLAAQFLRSVGGKCGVSIKTKYDPGSLCANEPWRERCKKGAVTPLKLRKAAQAGGLTWLYNWDGTLIPGGPHSASDVHAVTGAQSPDAYRDNKLFYAPMFWGAGSGDPSAKNYGFGADGGATKVASVDASTIAAGNLGKDCKYILPFVFGQNEPDHDPSAGGSAMTPAQGVAEWKVQTKRAYETGGYKEFVGPHVAYALPPRYGSNVFSGYKTWYEDFLLLLANDASSPGFGGFAHWKQTIHYLGYHTYQPTCQNDEGGAHGYASVYEEWDYEYRTGSVKNLAIWFNKNHGFNLQGLWLTETALGRGSTYLNSAAACAPRETQMHYLEKILPRYLSDPSVIGIAWFSADAFQSAYYDRDSTLWNMETEELTNLGAKYLQLCRENQGSAIQNYWTQRAVGSGSTPATCVPAAATPSPSP